MDNKPIRTVGDLRSALKDYEDEEQLAFILDWPRVMASNEKLYMECAGVQSTAGGRAGMIWFDPKKK